MDASGNFLNLHLAKCSKDCKASLSIDVHEYGKENKNLHSLANLKLTIHILELFITGARIGRTIAILLDIG